MLPLGEDPAGWGPGVEERFTFYYKSFLLDLCMYIHFRVHLFPIKIIMFILKRKALQARCDEDQDCGSDGVGGRRIVRSRMSRTQ